MRCYFLSKQSCALKIDGEFIGYAGNNLCETELLKSEKNNYDEKTFFEFIPLCDDFLPTRYLLKQSDDKNSFFKNRDENSDTNMRIIDLYGDLLLYSDFSRREKSSATNVQTKTLDNGVRATVFTLNGPCVLLEANGQSNFFSAGSEFSSVDFELSESGYLLAVAKGEKRQRLFLFSVFSKPELILVRDADEYYFNKSVFTAIKKNIGVCKIERRENFDLEKPQNSYVSFVRDVPIFKLNEKLLPFAFLEEVFLGANFEDYLSRDLKENKNYIPEFIGDFEFFLPPIKKNGGIILIKKNKQKAEFLSLTIKNGCVADINFL